MYSVGKFINRYGLNSHQRVNFLEVSNCPCLRTERMMAENSVPALTKFASLTHNLWKTAGLSGFHLRSGCFVFGVSVMPPGKGQMWDSQMPLKAAWFFPFSEELSQGVSVLLRCFLPQLCKQPHALMSTIHWAKVTGCKTTGVWRNHDLYRDTGLIESGGNRSQVDGMCLF